MNEVDNNLNSVLEIDEVLEVLEETPVAVNTPAVIEGELVDEPSSQLPVATNHSRDIEYDYETSRSTQRDLIEQGQEALTDLLKVAKESQHPRAYEVASGLIRNLSDMTDKLLDLHKKRKELEKAEGGGTNTGSNITVDKAVFVGSTADLLKQIKKA